MKLRAPEGCVAASHQGRLLEIAEDSSLDVDDEAWPILASHGFRPWNEMDASGKARSIGASLSSADSIGAATAAPIAPTDLGVEALSTLNRQGLFAFLRARGVSVSLPVTNEELRAAARRALAR